MIEYRGTATNCTSISNPYSVSDFGIYAVTVTDGACSASDSIVISERQDITLSNGWNMFSTYINQSDSINILVQPMVMLYFLLLEKEV